VSRAAERTWERLEGLAPRQVLLLALLLYVALNSLAAFGIYQFRSDGVEYLDIARNLAQGDGFVSTFRTYYVGPDGFPQPPQISRPLLFSLLAGGAYAVVPDPRSPQALNLLLGAASLVLLYLLLLRRFERAVAALSVLLLAVSSYFGFGTTIPLAEASALFCILATIAIADHRGPARFRFFGLGLWIGLAFLARPATLPLGSAAALYALVRGRKQGGGIRPLLRPAAAIVGGVCLATAPLWLLNLRFGLPLSYAPQSFLYSSLEQRDFLDKGFEFEPAGVVGLVSREPLALAKRLGSNGASYVQALFLERQRLGYLLLLWPALWAWFRATRGSPARAFAGLLVGLAALNVLFYSLSWAAAEPDRKIFPSFVLFLPPLLLGLRHVAGRVDPVPGRAFWFAGTLLLAAFALSAARWNADILGLRGEGKTRTFWDDASAEGSPATAAAEWLAGRLPRDAAIAASDPWVFMYELGRPTALLPTNLSPEQFERFVRLYGIRAVVNAESGERPGPPREALEAGIRRLGGSADPIRFGSYAVYLLEPG
jgi:hypothetical protein